MPETEKNDINTCPTVETEEEIAVFDVSDITLFKLSEIAAKKGQPVEDFVINILDGVVEEWERENGIIDLPECC